MARRPLKYWGARTGRRGCSIWLALIACLAPAFHVAAASAPLDALAYTVVRTPPAERATFPELARDRNVRLGEVEPFPERRRPPLFWYDDDGMNYGLAYQKGRAPLAILIAGTGGSFNSETSLQVARVLYGAGMHVLGLPSPTHPDFIVNASETGVPGKLDDDARDLYRAMRLAWDEVKDEIDVSEIYLTGYSLGAANAAWVKRVDDRERAFGFKKVLLLNPPVSLYNSTRILDGMYDRHVPKDPRAAKAFVDQVFASFAAVYTREEGANLDGDFLYAAYEAFRPGPDALETLIGTSFRLSSANMALASDVASRGGYMLASDADPGVQNSLTNVLKHATRQSFRDYIDKLYLPFFQARDPRLTRERAIAEAGLLPLADDLRSDPRVGLITNADDIILAPGEIEWLRSTFGEKAVVFADGGHCGNYQRRDFVDAVTRFFLP